MDPTLSGWESLGVGGPLYVCPLNESHVLLVASYLLPSRMSSGLRPRRAIPESFAEDVGRSTIYKIRNTYYARDRISEWKQKQHIFVGVCNLITYLYRRDVILK